MCIVYTLCIVYAFCIVYALTNSEGSESLLFTFCLCLKQTNTKCFVNSNFQNEIKPISSQEWLLEIGKCITDTGLFRVLLLLLGVRSLHDQGRSGDE